MNKTPTDMTRDELIQNIRENGDFKVKFAVSDIDGILRGKMIHIDKFMDIVEKGVGFCDVIFGWDAADTCYDNSRFTGWHTGYPDAFAHIDLSTFRRVPWDQQVPFFLADFSKDKAGEICPRTLLKNVRSQCAEMGFKAMFAQEFEWFNFKSTRDELARTGNQSPEPISPGMFGYSIIRPSQFSDFYHALFDQLKAFDIPLEGLHTETGPGVYEAAILYDEVMQAADKAILFKTAVKEIAAKHGIVASFMAKWNENLPGCSGHLHQSLWNEDGKNVFFQASDEHLMSETMKSYLAGLLACLPEILPMYAPTINSYKRLREGAWAPTTVTWGVENRTTAVRMIGTDEKSCRLEMRVPGSDSNPYLAMAASLASGLYGIKNKLKLEALPSVGNGYLNKTNGVLPSNLMAATERMAQSTLARELFGDSFVEHFTKTREWEWREYSKAVTNWELKRYFESI